MALDLDQDLGRAFEGPGSVLVRFGSLQTRGFFDDEESVITSGSGASGLEPGEAALVRERVLRIRALSLPGLARHQSLEIGAVGHDDTLTSYRVRDIRRTADGLEWEIPVAA